MAGHRQGKRKERTATKRADASRARFTDRINSVTTPREQVSVAFDYFRSALKHAMNRPATRPEAEQTAKTLVRQLSDSANRLLDAQIRSTNDR